MPQRVDGELVLAVNDEICNYRDLKDQQQQPYRFLIGSDCEVINALYRTEYAATQGVAASAIKVSAA